MSEFDALDEMDRWYLMAYWRTADAMASWEEKAAVDAINAQVKRGA